MPLTLEEIWKACTPSLAPPVSGGGAEGRGGFLSQKEIASVSTDTRTIAAGDLFVALKGERFDGHDYVARAFAAGAVAAVVEHLPEDLPQELQKKCLVVADTCAAYGRIARLWRDKFSIPVIGITGSVGKTTTKEMTALALSPLGSVLKSEKNENNEIGVPQTLLRLNHGHKAAVIEMGMRAKGEIAALAEIARPTIGVITMIGESHIELLGSRQAIADAKGELLEGLPAEGFAVLSADDDYFDHLRAKTRATLIATSLARAGGLHAGQIRQEGGVWRANVAEPDGARAELVLRSPARHDVANALLALAAACAAGVALDAAIHALEDYEPPAMRMETFETAQGVTVLNDSYNASPTSMASALLTLSSYPAGGRKIAFLGDMRELGDQSDALHRQVAEYACSLDLDEIYTVGDQMHASLTFATRHFATSELAADFAGRALSLGKGDVVLTKGSRAMAMEKIAEALRQK